MPPKLTLSERVDELVALVATQTEKAEKADKRCADGLADLTTRLDKCEKEASNVTKVPDTAWSALVALVRVAGQDAPTVRLLVGGVLAAVVILGLAAMALLNEHPELVGAS